MNVTSLKRLWGHRVQPSVLKRDDGTSMGILKRDVFSPSKLPQCFIIEVDDIAAGVVVQERSGYRFFAACAAFDLLNRQVFASAAGAEAACRALPGDRGAPGRAISSQRAGSIPAIPR